MKQLKISNIIGKLGEDIVVTKLYNDGFEIILRNYLEKTGEIDIIAKKDDILHFIEVKSVSCENLKHISFFNHRPEHNVHKAKLARMYKTIELYIIKTNLSHQTVWQIDIASVYVNQTSKEAKIEMLWNVIE